MALMVASSLTACDFITFTSDKETAGYNCPTGHGTSWASEPPPAWANRLYYHTFACTDDPIFARFQVSQPGWENAATVMNGNVLPGATVEDVVGATTFAAGKWNGLAYVRLRAAEETIPSSLWAQGDGINGIYFVSNSPGPENTAAEHLAPQHGYTNDQDYPSNFDCDIVVYAEYWDGNVTTTNRMRVIDVAESGNTGTSRRMLLPTLIAHEMGHCLGLKHRADDANALMYQGLPEESARYPDTLDSTVLQYLYNPGRTPP